MRCTCHTRVGVLKYYRTQSRTGILWSYCLSICTKIIVFTHQTVYNCAYIHNYEGLFNLIWKATRRFV